MDKDDEGEFGIWDYGPFASLEGRLRILGEAQVCKVEFARAIGYAVVGGGWVLGKQVTSHKRRPRGGKLVAHSAEEL
ncbi:MAG TPA: hypothetical protein VEY08_13190, partial [Chloroflexia bacterium]|nr:hypothetical protein [Chloroflexia bacterium]